jgi:hypothetical protein
MNDVIQSKKMKKNFYLFYLLSLLLLCFSFSLKADEIPLITLPILGAEPVTVSTEQKEIAEKLYRQAVLAAEKKHGIEAMQLVIDALKANPNHEMIRKILGFKLHEGHWRTDWEMNQLNKGFVDHPVFGWMLRDDVAKYEAGQRFIAKLGWVDAARDAELRTDIRNGWQIATEHYNILTNHSLEEGVRMARWLEHLYRAWKFLFFNILMDEEKLAEIFTNHAPPHVKLPRHQVFIFRNHENYVQYLIEIEPAFEPQHRLSNGVYYPQRKTSYFFPASAAMDEFDANTVRKTLYHEGTHQLFQEVRPRSNLPGIRNNYWMVEGIAMFMETFCIEGDRYVLGNMDDSRLYAAKIHRFDTEHLFYVPFGNLVTFGRREFQSHPRLAPLYSQSAGMTHFLMLGKNGSYRESALEFLRQIYTGATRPETLSKLTKRSYQELDTEYSEFLKIVP